MPRLAAVAAPRGDAAHPFQWPCLRRQFEQFVEPRVYKRHLRRSESPYVFRFLPMPLLERLMGRMLVLKAFKPLSAAMTLQKAA